MNESPFEAPERPIAVSLKRVEGDSETWRAQYGSKVFLSEGDPASNPEPMVKAMEWLDAQRRAAHEAKFGRS